jgi:hypothetical protein
VRPPWVGEKHRRDEVGARPVDEARADRRQRFDDPGAGPSHSPQGEADGGIEDFQQRLKVVLQGMSEGMWSHI